MELLQLDFGGIIQRIGNIFLILLIGGGIISLRFDLHEMTLKGLAREEKAARILGWLQISFGLALWLVSRLAVNYF